MPWFEAFTVLTAWAMICLIESVIPERGPANRPRVIHLVWDWSTPREDRARRSRRPDLPAPHAPHSRPRV